MRWTRHVITPVRIARTRSSKREGAPSSALSEDSCAWRLGGAIRMPIDGEMPLAHNLGFWSTQLPRERRCRVQTAIDPIAATITSMVTEDAIDGQSCPGSATDSDGSTAWQGRSHGTPLRTRRQTTGTLLAGKATR